MNACFSSSNRSAIARFLFPLIGLFLVNFTVIAVEREQATIESDDRNSIIQIRSSNFDSPHTWKSVDVEVCRGDCTFVVYFGESALLMEKNNAGQIRELTIATREKLNEWPARVEIEDLSLDLVINPLVDIGTKQYVLSHIVDPTIWRVSGTGNGHTEFDESKTIGSPFTDGIFVRYDPNAGPTDPPIQNPCAEDPVPEKRDVVCYVTGDTLFLSWNECMVTRCVGGYAITTSCTHKSVTLPKDIAESIFGSLTSSNCE